jgi:hypothetical protein
MSSGVLLLCESVSLFKLELNLFILVSVRSFYNLRPRSYMKTWGLTDGPKVVGILLQYLGR